MNFDRYEHNNALKIVAEGIRMDIEGVLHNW